MDLIVAKFDGNALKNGARISDAAKSAVIYQYHDLWKHILQNRS